MDRRTAVLAGLAVTGWAAFFVSLALRPDDAETTVEPESGALARDEGSLDAGAPMPSDHAVPDAEVREVIADDADANVAPKEDADRFDELESVVLEADEEGRPCYFLKRLGELGTERAKETLLEWLADPDFCAGTHRSRLFAEALAPYDDPRIGSLADRMLDWCIDNGLETEAVGYVRLLASKGGPKGRRRVVDLLGTSGRLQLFAAQNVGELRDPSLTDELLERAREYRFGSDWILDGIVAWGDPDARDAVRRFAESVDASASPEAERLRRRAFAAYGRGSTPSDLDREVAGYWTADQSHDRRSALAFLGAAAGHSELDPRLLRERSLSLVRDALRSRDADLVQEALYLIESNDVFWTDDYLALLEARASDPTLSEEERTEARSILVQARRGG